MHLSMVNKSELSFVQISVLSFWLSTSYTYFLHKQKINALWVSHREFFKNILLLIHMLIQRYCT